MKNIILAAILGCGLAFSGCDDNFDPELRGTLSPSNFPLTEKDFEVYTLQAYKPFGSKYGYDDVEYQNMFFSVEYGHLLMFDLPTDLFIPFRDWGGFYEAFSTANFNFLKNQGLQSNHFEKVRFVTRMTQIIGDLEASEISQEAKDRLTAEARMARGWTMYYLLHMYGPLPVIIDPALINTEEEKDLTRPERSTFVNYIKEDLEFAAEHLELTPAEYGRFNKGLAYGILMRLHMNEKNWEAAEAAGRAIQELNIYSLVEYANLFREETEVNPETIWAVSVSPNAIQDDLGPNYNALPYVTRPSDYEMPNGATGWAEEGVFTPTWDFYDAFDPADKRRELMLSEYTNNKGVLITRDNMPGPVLKKYPDVKAGNSFSGGDIVILRYADVLLMLAEAINNQEGPTAEAIGYVNEVRSVHGGLNALAAAKTSSVEKFNETILEERAFDLYFEGVRKMDLVRHGKWASALEAAGKVPEGQTAGPALFPVPQYAITVSEGKLTQTEGYE